jgi:hypothetical protein
MVHGRIHTRSLALLATLVALALPVATARAAKLVPAADVAVSAAQPARNFGAARTLAIARLPAERAFVRFALRATPPLGTRFALQLFALADAPSGLVVRHASDRPWDERRVTFRAAPGVGPRLARTGPLHRRRWVSIDVTHLVDTSGVASFALAAGGSSRVLLASREAGARLAPRLVVIGPAPPARPILPPPLKRIPASPPPPVPPPAAGSGQVDPAHPCGVDATAPSWQHVVWIVMENKDVAQIMGSPSAPYVNALGGACGSASEFFAEAHPSLPNYIAMTSGGTQGITDDAAPSSHPLAIDSIFSQLGTGGWLALQESMPFNCDSGNAGLYAVKHNPVPYFTGVAGDCLTQDMPLTDPPDLSSRFTFITPNLCNDTHDCSVGAGDAWLAQWVPKLLATPQYRSGTTALFVTWDEDDGSASQQIATIVVAPSVPTGTVDAARYDHYSLLRTTEEILGLPLLGQAQTSPSMRIGLHL